MGEVKNRILRRITALAAALVLIVGACPALIGCSFFSGIFGGTKDTISFDRNAISVAEGESFDLSAIVETTARSYTLKCADTSIAYIVGKKLTGRSCGVTYVTAETGSGSAKDELKVEVTEREADGIELSVSGSLTQLVEEISQVDFTPIGKGAAKAVSVKWYENGEYKTTRAAGEVYHFLPEGVGVYEIKALVKTLSGEYYDTRTVRVYNPVTANVVLSGSLEQTEPFTDVVFAVSVTSEFPNPENYFEWYINDMCIYSGSSNTYTLEPEAGRFSISLKVNGSVQYTAQATFIGSIIPDKPTVEFNNVHPHFYIHYDTGGMNAKVKIVDPSFIVNEYYQTDPMYASKFSNGVFDARGLVDTCSNGFSRGTYEFSVASLGDGDAVTASGYSQPYVFTQLTNSAKTYLETHILNADLYVTSESEYAAVTEYYIFFRTKTSQTPKVTYSCYIAFDLQGSATDLWNSVFETVSTSGRYYEISVSLNNNILTTSFRVDTVNDPSRQASGARASQLHAILPHINYDEAKYRPSNYVFAIDRREREVSVTYTDELYLAAQRGSKPVPTAGSKAQIVYAKARDVLSKICTNDMTDVQKAHAIYDWIMWKVTYDTPATKVASGGESLSAYYLEGVFGDGYTDIGGVAYSPYAVCDGMSKAYSLMCNIEGIPCVRVTGTAGENMSSAGGHAWNKVFINDDWYVVDCTWGDTQSTFNISGLSGTYELGMHEYLFLTRDQVASNHFEPHDNDNGKSIVYAPVASDVRFNVYDTMSYNGVAIDCGVSSSENKVERLRQIALSYAQSYKKTVTLDIPGCQTTSIIWQGIDVHVDGGLSSADKSRVSSAVSTAIKSVLHGANVNVSIVGNIVIILVKT